VTDQIQFVALGVSLGVMAIVFQLIRRRKLREEYALLWFLAGSALIVVSLWPESLDWIARLAGVAYPPNVLLLAAIALGFLLAMHYSVSLSRLADQNKRLAQEVAILQEELRRSQHSENSARARPE
jgi:hypothetical protein